MKSIPNPKGILGLLSLTSLGAAIFLPDTYHQLDRRDGQAWPYGVIGDSWGSGVSYNNDTLYENNKDSCLRTKQSRGPRMEANTTWISHDTSSLRDAACSGSNLGDIVLGQHQMENVGNPDVIIMTSSGNKHSDPTHNYGNAYVNDPDRSGDCAKAPDAPSEYITNPSKMAYDLIITIDDLFDDPAVSDYDKWCNKGYWSIPNLKSKTPYLSVNLRPAFNDHVSKINNLYKTTAESDKYKAKVRYIDVDSGFAGHRFCEPGANHGPGQHRH